MPKGIYIRTKEIREKIRQKLIGHKVSDKTRLKMKEKHKGKTFSNERKRNIQIAVTIAMNKPETKEKISRLKQGNRNMLGKHHSIETRLQMRKTALEQMKVGKRFIPIIWFDTKPELEMEKGLLTKGYMIQKQYFINEVGLVDFYLPEENIVIEVDGEYWHGLLDQKERDKVRNKKLKRLGFKLFRFLDTDVYQNLDKCLQLIGN